MYRHIRIQCPVKKEEDKKKLDVHDRLLSLEKENEALKAKMDNIEKKPSQKAKKIINGGMNNTNNTNNINNNLNNCAINNNNIVNNNVTLVAHGMEDMDRIDKKDILKAVQNGFRSVVNLTEVLHFNPKYPEYQNIYISNIKDKFAMVYDGKDWNLTMKDKLIDRIYEDKKSYIEENLDEFVQSMSPSRKNALDRWLNTAETDAKIADAKNDIKLLLYNKRNTVIDKLKVEPKKPSQSRKAIKDG